MPSFITRSESQQNDTYHMITRSQTRTAHITMRSQARIERFTTRSQSKINKKRQKLCKLHQGVEQTFDVLKSGVPGLSEAKNLAYGDDLIGIARAMLKMHQQLHQEEERLKKPPVKITLRLPLNRHDRFSGRHPKPTTSTANLFWNAPERPGALRVLAFRTPTAQRVFEQPTENFAATPCPARQASRNARREAQREARKRARWEAQRAMSYEDENSDESETPSKRGRSASAVSDGEVPTEASTEPTEPASASTESEDEGPESELGTDRGVYPADLRAMPRWDTSKALASASQELLDWFAYLRRVA